jgi:hypothetical protein
MERFFVPGGPVFIYHFHTYTVPSVINQIYYNSEYLKHTYMPFVTTQETLLFFENNAT